MALGRFTVRKFKRADRTLYGVWSDGHMRAEFGYRAQAAKFAREGNALRAEGLRRERKKK